MDHLESRPKTLQELQAAVEATQAQARMDEISLRANSKGVEAGRAARGAIGDVRDSLKWLAAFTTGLLIVLYQELRKPPPDTGFWPVSQSVGILASASFFLASLVAVALYMVFVDIPLSKQSAKEALRDSDIVQLHGLRALATLNLKIFTAKGDVATANVWLAKWYSTTKQIQETKDPGFPNVQAASTWLPPLAWACFGLGLLFVVADLVAKIPTR